MSHQFMCKKSSFSIQECAILFTLTTILVSLVQALKFFNLNSIPMDQILLLFTLN